MDDTSGIFFQIQGCMISQVIIRDFLFYFVLFSRVGFSVSF